MKCPYSEEEDDSSYDCQDQHDRDSGVGRRKEGVRQGGIVKVVLKT